jgi:hypothetical protein
VLDIRQVRSAIIWTWRGLRSAAVDDPERVVELKKSVFIKGDLDLVAMNVTNRYPSLADSGKECPFIIIERYRSVNSDYPSISNIFIH